MMIIIFFFLFDNVIPFAQVVKGLGLGVNINLLINPHCLNSCKMPSWLNKFLFESFRTRNIEFFIELYKCHVLPLLD